MSCMTHLCTRCDYHDADNGKGPSSCPWCGAPVMHVCDETPDFERDFADEDDDTDEDDAA